MAFIALHCHAGVRAPAVAMARPVSVRWAGALIVLAIAALASSDHATAGSLDRPAASAIVAGANAARAAVGLPPLAPEPHLARAAERYAQALAADGAFSHVGASGSTPDARAEANGYTGWSVVAENLSRSAGAPDPAAVVAAWMASDAHRRNVLAPDATDAGAACYVTSDARRSVCVLEFGAR